MNLIDYFPYASLLQTFSHMLIFFFTFRMEPRGTKVKGLEGLLLVALLLA